MYCTLVRMVRVAVSRAQQRNNSSVWKRISKEPEAEQLALNTEMVSAAQMLFATLPVSPYVNPLISFS